MDRFSSDGHNISMDDFSKMMHSRDEEMGGVSEEVEIEDAFKVFDKVVTLHRTKKGSPKVQM